MKRKIFVAALAGVCAVSTVALSACNTADEVDEILNIIKNEEAWNDAFENLDYVNFSIRVKITSEMRTGTSYCEISENAVYYTINNDVEFYSLKNNDGTYTTYHRGWDEEKFVLLSDNSDRYFVGASTETVLKISYADYFELFSFNSENGTYVYDGEITPTAYSFYGNELGMVYCFNNEIKAENNKIVSIKSNYRFETEEYDENASYSLEYFNINSTTVTVPASVIENAIKEEDIYK